MTTTIDLASVRVHRASDRPMPAAATAVRPTRSGQATTGVRLTRRGRLVVLLVVVVAAFTVFSMLSGPAASTDTPHRGSYRTVVVQPGETIWDIAGEVAPEQDRRAVIADIVELNAINDPGSLRVGEPLAVPVQ